MDYKEKFGKKKLIESMANKSLLFILANGWFSETVGKRRKIGGAEQIWVMILKHAEFVGHSRRVI